MFPGGRTRTLFEGARGSPPVDGRFLFLGAALLVASLGVHAAGYSNSLWAWGIPFAAMLLFLGLVGQGPGAGLAHYYSEMNTEGHPSEAPVAAAGEAQSPAK